jgi:hypothetical protein
MIWDDVRAVAPPQVATKIFRLRVEMVPGTDSRRAAFQLCVYSRLVSRPVPARMMGHLADGAIQRLRCSRPVSHCRLARHAGALDR